MLKYRGRLISCHQIDGAFDLVDHPGAACILPIDAQGNFLLIRQWRRAVQKSLLEIPAGTLEPGESPYACADRELREETGFRAQKLTFLGGCYSAPGFCNEYLHIFLAEDLVHDPLIAEDTEHIDLVPVTSQDMHKLICDGSIQDSKTLASILLYRCKML